MSTTLTPKERRAIKEASQHFRAARPHASNRGIYRGVTADEALALRGIGYGYRNGLTTYATIINAVIDGEDWSAL